MFTALLKALLGVVTLGGSNDPGVQESFRRVMASSDPDKSMREFREEEARKARATIYWQKRYQDRVADDEAHRAR